VAAGFWDSYLKLVDWSKHQSTHAQGNVCFGVPIVQYVPFNRVSEGI
jgi:DNA polymerase III alpha subunit